MCKKETSKFSQAQSNTCFITQLHKVFLDFKVLPIDTENRFSQKKLIYMHTITTQQNNNGEFKPTSSRMPRPDVNYNI